MTHSVLFFVDVVLKPSFQYFFKMKQLNIYFSAFLGY